MESIFRQCSTNPEQLDIFVKRILAKFSAEEQILFGECGGGKVPVQICIHKKDGIRGVKCISDIKIIDWSTNQDIICNHKARLSIKFKVVLFIKYEDDSFGVIVLPDDSPAKFCFKTTFPVIIGNNESLAITADNFFLWTLDVPFNLFDAPIAPEVFDDPTVQSHLLIKAVRPDFDVLNDCTCTPPSDQSVSVKCPSIPGTLVDLAIYVDLLDKFGVDQDILIQGIPIDC